ncbi:MAG: ATP-binding protein [Cyclobacteriaceae bacterium]
MTLEQIKHLVAKGEGQHLEFKKKVAFPEKVVRELVAFANTSGGHLLVGVDDDGSISGLRYPEEEHFALTTAIQQLCVPKVRYESETIAVSKKKSVLYYQIKAAKRKPHYAKDQPIDKYGKAYVRVADKTVQASREMTQILKRGNGIKDVRFTYGDKEGILMKYLDEYQSITVDQFSKAANLPRRVASGTLVRLVLAQVLRIIPNDGEDLFELRA